MRDQHATRTGHLRPVREIAPAVTAVASTPTRVPSNRSLAASAGASPARAADGECETCKGAGWLVRRLNPVGTELVPCPCRTQPNRDRLIAKLARVSGLTPAMQAMTFEAFTTPSDDLRAALDEARQFAATPEGWLYLYGGTGRGKTHLMAAIAQALVGRGIPALYVVVPSLLDKLRSSMNGRDEGFWELWRQIQSAEVLLLDDLGAEKSSEWAIEKLYILINDRYLARSPMVVASNLRAGEIGGRIGSRLCDVRLATHVSIAAPDYRYSE